jgi:hypothetical protein
MSQQNDKLHVTADGSSVILPCSCGVFDDNFSVKFWPDEDNSEFGYFCVYLGPGQGLRYRLISAWKTFWNNRSYAETLVNLESAKTFRDWLTVKITEAENGKA